MIVKRVLNIVYSILIISSVSIKYTSFFYSYASLGSILVLILVFFQDEHGNTEKVAKKVEEAKIVGNPYRRKKEKTADDEIRILHEAYQFLLKRPVLVLLSKFYPNFIQIKSG